MRNNSLFCFTTQFTFFSIISLEFITNAKSNECKSHLNMSDSEQMSMEFKLSCSRVCDAGITADTRLGSLLAVSINNRSPQPSSLQHRDFWGFL